MVGAGPLADVIHGRLGAAGVDVIGLIRDVPTEPAVSTVLVTEATGERAVVSMNATGSPRLKAVATERLLMDTDVLLVDGHHMDLTCALVAAAKKRSTPVVFDGDSWKPGTERLLQHVDIAAVSADFVAPEEGDVLQYLLRAGCSVAIQTRGPDPVLVRTADAGFSVPVPHLSTALLIDTLGAGDVFHGALAFGIVTRSVERSVSLAVNVASESCRHRGPVRRASLSVGSSHRKR